MLVTQTSIFNIVDLQLTPQIIPPCHLWTRVANHRVERWPRVWSHPTSKSPKKNDSWHSDEIADKVKGSRIVTWIFLFFLVLIYVNINERPQRLSGGDSRGSQRHYSTRFPDQPGVFSSFIAHRKITIFYPQRPGHNRPTKLWAFTKSSKTKIMPI